MCDTIPCDKSFVVSMGVEKETAGKKKLARGPLGVVASGKH